MENTIKQPFEALKSLIDECGSQHAAAKKLGITPQYMSDILAYRRGISAQIAHRLGFIKQTVYVRTGE